MQCPAAATPQVLGRCTKGRPYRDLRWTLLELEYARMVAYPVQEPLAPRHIWNLGRTRVDDPARLAKLRVRRLVVPGREIRLGGPAM